MNIVQEVLKEHSKAMCDRIVKYVGNDRVRFNELVNVFLKGPYRVTQRAGWPLSYCVELHPELINPHLKRIIQNLKSPGLHDSVKRNTVRLMQFIDLPKSLQGAAADACFGFMSNPREPIAVRCFSMTVLAHLSREQPELKKELRIILEDQLPYATAGFASRARRVLKELRE